MKLDEGVTKGSLVLQTRMTVGNAPYLSNLRQLKNFLKYFETTGIGEKKK